MFQVIYCVNGKSNVCLKLNWLIWDLCFDAYYEYDDSVALTDRDFLQNRNCNILFMFSLQALSCSI